MSRRALAVIAAILIGIAGTTTVALYARQADARALAGQEAVRVYVVAKEVPAGTTAAEAVEDGLITQELIARKAVPDDALTAVDGGYGQLMATAALQPGSLVLRPSFASRPATQGTLVVPKGQLAVSVALDDPSHVGAFVAVGSKVAIFDTFNVQESDKAGQTPAGDKLADRHEFTRSTRLLLQEVEVLAIGATTDAPSSKPDDGEAVVEEPAADQKLLVTVAVSQAEAELLIHGSRTGTLTFALLGPDTKAQPGQGIDDRHLFQVTP
jgi:pilus assembly protein CpaB